VHRAEWSRCRTFAAARLDDEDILAAHAFFNLHPRLAALELVKQHLCRRYAEVVADGPVCLSAAVQCGPSRGILSELRMRGPTQDDNVAHHDGGGGVAIQATLRAERVKGARCRVRAKNRR
jgi:hypothetical protein